MVKKNWRLVGGIRIWILAIGLIGLGAVVVACGKANGYGVGGKVIITGGSR